MKKTKRTALVIGLILILASLAAVAVQADLFSGLLTTPEESAPVYYTVTGLVVDGDTATVSYSAPETALVAVALYTEDGKQLLRSAVVTVEPGETAISATLNGEAAANFRASAFLLDTYDMSPLCPSYTTDAYVSGYTGLENGGFGQGESTDFGDLFSSQDGETPAAQSVVQGDYDGVLKTSSFTGLQQGEAYVLLAIADTAAEPTLTADQLLYIAQANAASDGTLSFTYALNIDDYQVLLCGPSDQNLKDAQIIFPSMVADGTVQRVCPVVSYNGVALVEGQDYVIVGDTEFTEAGDYTCYIRGICAYAGFVECPYTVSQETSVVPTIKLNRGSATFEDEVYVSIYCTITDVEDIVTVGLVTSADDVVDETDTYVTEYDYKVSGSTYVVRTPGIPAKNLGEDIYFKVYALLSDGSYAYSRQYHYSPKDYALDRLANSTDNNLKSLCVAMLNYGAAAQTYFGYNTENLANADLTDAYQALVNPYDSTMVNSVSAADAAKIGEFANTKGYSSRKPGVSFEGAFSISYYLTPRNTPENGVTLYYWSKETYDSVEVLTRENADGVFTTVGTDGIYKGVVEGIAAKEIDQPVYTAGIYEYGGVTYPTGVMVYSLSAYCIDRIANGSEEMKPLAEATAVYGYYAKQYFASLTA